MKRIIILSALLTLVIVGMAACGDSTANTVANANKAVVNAVEKVANTAGNAVNSVSNAVSKARTDDPKDFITAAAQGGMAEVELGKMAATKATNAEVKKFGQMMVTDHTKLNDEIKALAKKQNVTLPSDIGSHKSTVDKLNGKTGADFDKAYVDDMVSGHESVVADFERQANNSTDAEVKALAAKALPGLKKHLETIKAIQAKMK